MPPAPTMPVAYVSLVPLWACGNVLLVLFVLGATLLVATPPRRRTVYVPLLGVIAASLAFWGLFVAFTDVHREATAEMTWEYGTGTAPVPGREHLVLRFKAQPGLVVGTYSSELGAYLRTLPSRDVTVRFEVTTDFGHVRGFNETQIGMLRKWDQYAGYAGGGGSLDRGVFHFVPPRP